MVVVLGAVPVIGQLVISSASAASASCSATLTGTALNRTGWTATASNVGDPTSQALDGNLTTRYSSGTAQTSGMWFQVNMGSPQSFDEVDMAVPNSSGDYARGYNIQVSSDGTNFTTVESCTGTGTPEVATFGLQTAQYVRVTLTQSLSPNWWSIDEFYLYNTGTSTTTVPTTTTTAPTTTTAGGGGTNCSAATSGTELSQSGWAASTNTPASGGDVASNAVDGNLTTRFSSDRAQTVGDYLQVNLGSAKSFNILDLQVPNSAGDYARGYSVGVSSNGTSFTTVATCTGTGTPEIVSFGSVSAQYVRVTITTAYSGSWWSVDELDLYNGNGTTTTTGATTSTSGVTTTTSPTTTTTIGSGASTVKVTGSNGNWNLTVNGSTYYIKGMTWGPANSDAATYMPGLQKMGVNTIRTWGTDSTTAPLLSTAAQYGIRVINGFWLNYGTDWINNTSYESSEQSTILQYVNQYKTSPGTLMWDLGNEVLLNNPNYFSGAQLASENAAYLQYVNNLAASVKSADPNHPVTSTEAFRPAGSVAGEPNGVFGLYQQYCPNLDLWAMNAYGTIGGVYSDWAANGSSKPYIITEAGSYGEWEAPADQFGAPVQENDPQMVSGYQTAWNDITAHPSSDLGVTFFNYGTQNDLGGVWYNTIVNGWERPIDYAISAMFGGSMGANQAPNFTAISIPNVASVPAGGQFTVNMTVSSPEDYPLHYQVMFSNRYLPVPDGCGPAWCSLSNSGLTAATFTQSGSTLTVTAPKWQGIWKIYVYAIDNHNNVGIDNENFLVVPPPVNGTNVSQGKPTTASSEQPNAGEGCPCTAVMATDATTSGQPDTSRWGSAFSDPQWLQVDLGSTQSISTVQLVWENAYASAYQIQVSNDGTNWTSVYSTTSGQGGVETIPLSGVSGRYVRFYGTTRATSYGYSLWDFRVFH